jgi:hypothetical protein
MAGRKPDFRLVYVQENKGRKTSFRIGAGWKKTGTEKSGESVSIEVNIGLPLVLEPHTKLVLFENTDDNNEERPEETGWDK